MSEHHRVSKEGQDLGALTSLLYERGRKVMESQGMGILNLPMLRDEMCASCACRAGTVPNGCAQTQLDLIKAVVDGKSFLCHAPMDGRMCAGYVGARAGHVASPLPKPVIDIANSWEYSPPDEPEAETPAFRAEAK